ILEDKRNEPYIKWRDDGLSFIVVDTAGFAEKVIPLHFRHSKYPSFVRQLNLHGFRKMQSVFQGSLKPVKGPYVDEIYSNPDFQRDDPSLMVRIKR
ncbi:heat shock transcription factor DNA-binding domain, partial [Ramicandelaber brevisporus]